MAHPLETHDRLNLGAAVFLAKASQAAYSEDASADAWAKSEGFPGGVKSFSRENVQGFWAVQGQIALLALRGTQSTAHWIRNLTLAPSNHQWGRVHLGFHDGIVDVEPDMQEFIGAARNARFVWVTGHSLGGALALIAAARLKMSGISSTTYTYGQPKMCFSNFADRFASELPGRYVRFVNQNDIVPRVPPFYVHFGNLKRIVRPGVLESFSLESAAAAPDPVTRPQLAAAKATIEASVMESAVAIAASGIDKPLVIDSELPPLTNQQFLELKIALEADAGLEGAGLEFALPSFKDHGIANYITLLTQIRDQS